MLNIVDYSGKNDDDKKDYLQNLNWEEVVKFGKKLELEAIADNEEYFIKIEML